MESIISTKKSDSPFGRTVFPFSCEPLESASALILGKINRRLCVNHQTYQGISPSEPVISGGLRRTATAAHRVEVGDRLDWLTSFLAGQQQHPKSVIGTECRSARFLVLVQISRREEAT